MRPVHIKRRPRRLCREHEQPADTDFSLSLGETSIQPATETVHTVGAIRQDDTQTAEETSQSWMYQWSPSRLREVQMNDLDLKEIIQWKEAGGERPKWQDISPRSPTLKTYWSHWDQLHVVNGILYKRWVSEWGDKVIWKLVVPQDMRTMVCNSLHKHRTAGHLGEKKTIERLGERYWWVNWREFARNSCKKCDLCAAKKAPRKTPRAPMKICNVGAPLERIAIDCMGPLPESDRGNKHILVVGDHFTKWMEAYAMPNQEAKTVARILSEEFICRYGVPRIILSDQGRNFESTLFEELCELFDVDKVRTTALHPQTNGMIERQNKVIQNMLSMFVSTNQRDWDIHLPYMMMAYRSANHESLKCSPCEMMFGRNVELPIDIALGRPPEEPTTHSTEYVQELQQKLELVHEYARQNLSIASQKQKKYYDHRCDKRQLFEKGDAVWLHNPQRKKGVCPKLSLQWQGPFLVIERLCDVVFKIQRSARSTPKVVHANRLKKYLGDDPPVSWLVTPQPTESNSESAEGNDSNDFAETPVEDSPLTTEPEPFGDESEEGNDAPFNDPSEEIDSPNFVQNSNPELATELVGVRPTDGLRRSTRNRKPPKRYEDFVLDTESLDDKD